MKCSKCGDENVVFIVPADERACYCLDCLADRAGEQLGESDGDIFKVVGKIKWWVDEIKLKPDYKKPELVVQW